MGLVMACYGGLYGILATKSTGHPSIGLKACYTRTSWWNMRKCVGKLSGQIQKHAPRRTDGLCRTSSPGIREGAGQRRPGREEPRQADHHCRSVPLQRLPGLSGYGLQVHDAAPSTGCSVLSKLAPTSGDNLPGLREGLQ